MSKHLQRDIEQIRRDLLAQFGLVEKLVDDAVRTLVDGRQDLADTVLRADRAVDEREVLIEEHCLKTLALHQPVAIDLRWIATVVKINADLERIADLACNITERAQELYQYSDFPIPDQVSQMVRLSMTMMKKALDAFVDLDGKLAREVIRLDNQVDQLNREAITELITLMKSHPDYVEPALHCFSAARHIERIADHAENIAEEVIYIVEGEIIRHRHGDLTPDHPAGQ